MDKETLILSRGYLEKSKQKSHAAEVLFKDGAYEDAVSRAYYCCFHAAQAVLLSEGLTTRSHQGVVNLFGLHFVKTGKFGKKFGRFLANLKDDRENGDYEIFSGIDKEVARKAIKEAKQFLRETERYLKKKGLL